MKITAKLSGSCMVKYSPEEVIPLEEGVQVPSLVQAITETFKVTQQDWPFDFPIPGGGLIPHLIFTNGQFTNNNKQVSVKQIWLANNGITIQAQDTDEADIIADRLFSLLSDLKFRFENPDRKHFGIFIAQFEHTFESLDKLAAIGNLINGALGRKQLVVKRLAFGSETARMITQVTVDTVDEIDFVIERRNNQPFSTNRYYCAAPLRFQDHCKILEEIEKILGS
jgi:hypothetical protein